ncbi:hypothetical protein [Dinghuibacter silviterrae]|uniref:Peptidase S24/S26A/S26B/S26C domain-containing protein n=1 Tax=Dinghuibacter silviterrae TaxID=1539049 RepID=A0A4R8DH30_9BACT|nr:hypothetical protein [Dinghuibacter silviterrae]TDW96416.1 hypothetical protein EDB95_4247 [Dinghuibacter silviterrae]
MSIKTDIERVLKDLRRYGKDRRTIEQELRYSPNYIDQMLSKGGNARFYTALKRYHDMLTQQAQEETVVREDPAPYGNAFWSYIPEYRHCNYATTAHGSAMHPLILHNAIVGGKLLSDPGFVVYGEIYIIRTQNGMETIRYVQPGAGDNLLLVALKEGVPATELRREDIEYMYHAQFVVNPL